jgi:hypothetical protein
MQEVGNEATHEAGAVAGRDVDPEVALSRLEDRVQRVGADSEQVGALEAKLKNLGEERDRLREERVSAALRVEAILERLEALGLE